MNYTYLLGIIIIGVGLSFIFRGYKMKSGARTLIGIAAIFFGAAQFFTRQAVIGTTLLAIGFMLFVAALYMVKVRGGRIVRTSGRRRGQ